MPKSKVNKEVINSIDKIKREINKKKQKAMEIHNLNEVIVEKDNLSSSNLSLADAENNNKTNKSISKGNEGINKGTKSTRKANEVTSKRNKGISKENEDIRKSSEGIDKGQVDEPICKTKYIVFMLNDEEYAIELVNVREIIRVPKIKRVPNSVYIEGICNLRGELVTIIDIHKRYNMSQSEYNDNSRVIVMEFNGCIVGIIVDEVLQVLDIEKSSVKLIIENNSDTKEGYINGIIMSESGKKLIMIMDVQSIVNINGLGSILKNIDEKAHQKISTFIEVNEESEQLIIFNINGAEYAFYISEVREIISMTKIAKVPNSSNFIEGVISLRNELIGIVNITEIINMNSESINKDGSILIVDIGTLTYGVIVDKVSEVKLISKKDLLKPSQVVGSIDVKIVKEFASMDNGKRVITVLDSYELINLEELKRDFKANKKEVGLNNPDKNLLDSKKMTESIIIFKIENQEYGIDINFVEEINTINKITDFPNKENFVEGLVNLRGDMIPIINLRTFFGLDSKDNDPYCKILIVKIKNIKAGIRINSASEVLSISRDVFQDYPEVLNPENNKRCIDGMIKLNDGSRIILYLNLNKVFDFM